MEDAEASLTAYGLKEIEYIANIDDGAYVNTLFEEEISLEEQRELALQTYLFTGKNEGQPVAVAVSVMSGHILATTIVENGSAIDFFIRHSS